MEENRVRKVASEKENQPHSSNHNKRHLTLGVLDNFFFLPLFFRVDGSGVRGEAMIPLANHLSPDWWAGGDYKGVSADSSSPGITLTQLGWSHILHFLGNDHTEL